MESKPRKMDRSNWGYGPWDAEPEDRIEGPDSHGFPTLMQRGPSGAWCGYVAVPPGHWAHGKSWHDPEGGSLEVHGGITYGEECAGSICHVPKPGDARRRRDLPHEGVRPRPSRIARGAVGGSEAGGIRCRLSRRVNA